jgi:hypothetical protein
MASQNFLPVQAKSAFVWHVQKKKTFVDAALKLFPPSVLCRCQNWHRPTPKITLQAALNWTRHICHQFVQQSIVGNEAMRLLPINVIFYYKKRAWSVFLSIVCLSFVPKPGVYLYKSVYPGNTKGGSITVPLTSCLTGLD